MPYISVFSVLMIWTSSACASDVPIAEQMRAIELQQKSDEAERWLRETRAFYFNAIAMDQTMGQKLREKLETLAAPYKEQFLKLKEVDHLCGLMKEAIKEEGMALDGLSCAVESSILKVSFDR